MFDVLQSFINAFGAATIVPVVIIIVALFLKVPFKKALMAGLNAGVGLQGFTLVLNSFTPIISPVIEGMIKNTGINLPTFDVGWQAASIVGYSTQSGMIFLALGIALQTILFLIKWTDVFQPSDLWNNYSYCVWGSMVYAVTKNMFLALGLMVLLNMYSLLFADILAPRWSKYYGYPNCTIIAMHNIEPTFFGIIMDPLLNKLGFNRIKLNPDALQKQLGMFGEPTVIGFVIGAVIGLIGNITQLNKISSWGTILTVGIATAAVMAIFPKIAGIFASAFTPITDAARKSATTKQASTREWYLAINDAAGFGESATLTTGLLLIPIMVFLAFILPGNETIPVIDLVAIPFMVQALVAISNGNMAKVIVNGAIWFSLGLYVCTYTAPLFTKIAMDVGIALPAGAMLITSFNILGKPLILPIFLAFLSKNPLGIALSIVAYFGLWFLFKRNKKAIYDYLDRQAEKNLPNEGEM
ncbi:MAG TPA: PTS galactitol transporter subunit IIC [Tepidanaerobacter syntrophicus]|uniref:PTS galactitol transporter subunit IIC n=1 Tax=Tepidanaerobacter syntrophicus TaxID=224999 RepID=UPI0017579054|nr:PTS transporter subunit IIC [Tepidanaerobacter syntrophicus]HHV82873.1 PTS galactitol transporter subunit IIC [Tepidanaerobacter syntrophicus]